MEKEVYIELGMSILQEFPNYTLNDIINILTEEFDIVITENDIWKYRANKLLYEEEDYEIENNKIKYYGHV
jgi:hypothetical protein